MRILTRYVCGEIILNFEIALISMSGLLMIHQVGRLIKTLGTSTGLLEFLPLLMPTVFVFSIPLAVLTATLLTFSRISSDQEMHAMYSCNISFSRILSPVIVLTLFITMCALLNIQFVVPWCSKIMVSLKGKAAVGLVMNAFSNGDKYSDKNLKVLKIKGIHEDGSKKGIFIHQKQAEGDLEVFAKEYRLKPDYQNGLMGLALKDAWVNARTVGEQKRDYGGYSKSCDLSIDLGVKKKKRSISELSFTELLYYSKVEKKPKKIRKALFEFHRKLSVSFSCIFLGALGMFIGLWMKSGNKFLGVLMALGFVFLVYFPLMSLGRWLVMDPEILLSPIIGGWAPFLIMLILTFFMKPSNKGI